MISRKKKKKHPSRKQLLATVNRMKNITSRMHLANALDFRYSAKLHKYV